MSGDEGDDDIANDANDGGGGANGTTDDGEDGVLGDFDDSGRIGHFSPDTPSVDVYVNDELVLADVSYRTMSDRRETETGTYDVEVTVAGDPDSTMWADEVEFDGGNLTGLAIGESSGENHELQPAIFEDDLGDPGDDARVRLIHASPDAPAVDVTVDDGAASLFDDVDFGEAAATEIQPSEYTLEVRRADPDDGELLATFDFSADSGSVHTAVATGYLDPEAAPAEEPFDLEVYLDN